MRQGTHHLGTKRAQGQNGRVKAPPISSEEARAFLEARYRRIQHLERLGGGFWSSAFRFIAGGQELVVRFGTERSWFEADRAAMAFSSPRLPVPEMVEIGEMADRIFAISRRHHGVFLELVRPDQAYQAGPMLAGLLEALFSIPKSDDLPVGWQWSPPTTISWRHWLVEALGDRPDREEVSPWRETLAAADPALGRLQAVAETRVTELLDACPERRDLVHRDLLHGNVLVTEDASEVTAVFSWKCSVRGDFLYDVAWCTFWAPFHPGIAAIEPWGLALSSGPIQADRSALVEAAVRHHCYELHIGLEHLAFNTWVGDRQALVQTAQVLSDILERGPLVEPR